MLLVGSTLLVTLLVYFFGSKIFTPLGISSPFAVYFLLPMGVFGGGLFAILNYFAIRSKNFPSISIAKIYQTACGVAFQLCGFKLGHYGLIGGQVLGQAVGSFSLLKSLFNRERFKSTSWSGVKGVLSRYKRFPLFSMPDALANTASVHLPAVLFAYFFSPASAGFYLLANRVLQLPASVIGSAVGQVFYGEASATRAKEDLFATVAKLYAQLANIGIVPLFVLVFIAPELFSFVFGDEWRFAGEFARYMAPWIFFVFVASPFTSLFAILEKQSQGMFFQFIVLFFRVIAILIGGFYEDLILTVALFSAVSTIFWILFLFWVTTELKGSFRTIISCLFTALFKGLFAISPLALLFVLPQNISDLALVLVCTLTFLSITKYYIGLIKEGKN
jgi:O-antigen/teichoic acid export membrane protein